jgi:glycosidase
MIGETYGSPQLIGSYVKTGMLNSQFDFNMYFAIRDALVKGESFENINKTVLESMAAYGAHHTMGNISGNHDQIRFASMAGEAIGTNTNGKEEGWTEEIGIGNAEKAYVRALQQEALNLTLPGVPCIYQGDEYAEVGGNDPDNRHMMKFDGLNEKQLEFKEAVQELIKMRRSSMALMYGEYVPVTVTKDTLVFDRIYFDQSARVTIMRDQPVEITL